MRFKSDAQRRAVMSKMGGSGGSGYGNEESGEDHWVEAVLKNDENSTDLEMIDYFMKEGNMSQSEASYYVRQRQDALLDPLNFVIKPYQHRDDGEKFPFKPNDKVFLTDRVDHKGIIVKRNQPYWYSIKFPDNSIKIYHASEIIKRSK